MPISSNQYLQKISLEHPIALWSLDDDAYYVKLMSDSARDVGTWEDVNVASITNISPSGIQVPNPNRPCTEIVGQEVGGALYANAFIRSANTFSSNGEPFSVSFNLYSYGTDIRYLTIGYQNTTPKTVEGVYAGPTSVAYLVTNHGFVTGDYVVVSGTVPTAGNENWYDYSGVITKINNNAFYFQNHNRQYDEYAAPNEYGGEAFKGEQKQSTWLYGRSDEWLLLSETFSQTATNAKLRIKIYYDGDYEKTFLINDFNIGNNFLEFAYVSNGQEPVSLPSIIATAETHGVPAEDFLSDSNLAYYIVSGNKLKTKNSSIPLVCGSSNTTILYPNNNGPSLIFPGFGLLNEYGKYKNYNLETFIRVNGNTTTPKRILGPLQSTDGVYIYGSFIILKIGKNVKSAFIGDWFTPMMLNLQYTKDSVQLWVNTDKLIDIDISQQDISFPEEFLNNENQDWFGFYSYDELDSIEVDTISIYPYIADEFLLKRRFSYAKAIKSDEMQNLSLLNDGKFLNFQYDLSNHGKNYSVPFFSKWKDSRVFNNLQENNNVLYSPDYKIPEIELGSKTYQDWLDDIYAIQNEQTNFICLKPNSSYNDINGYFYFSSKTLINNKISGIYLVVKKLASSIEEQRLITIYDRNSTNYFKISLSGTTLNYTFNYNGVDQTPVYTTSASTINNKISVGLNFESLSNNSDSDLALFFQQNDFDIYVGGMPNESKTFDGYIYKLGLCDNRSITNINNIFTNGYIQNITQSLENNIATYTLLAKEFVNTFMLDIATKSYLEIPIFLSNLGSYNENILGLDFIQLNIDYPECTYIVNNNFDTSNELVKSYISFEENLINPNQITYNSNVLLNKNKIIDSKSNWQNKKYEFIDHTIVYCPSSVNLNDYSIVVHLEIISYIFSLLPKIKYVELVGKELFENKISKISSISSEEVIHYSINNNEDDYKNNAAVFLTKETSPTLHLNNKSGIRVVNSQ